MAISDALVSKALASQALLQMTKRAVFPRVGVGSYEQGNFQRDDRVKVRRPKRRRAANINPRSSPLVLAEGEFFSADVVLERLWASGFPVYGSDPTQSLELYINETASMMADSIATPNDEYLYGKFRTWSATTGAVALGANSPVAICAALDGSNALKDFDAATLRSAATILDGFEVPDEDRFAVLSTNAKGSFLGDSVLVDGFAAGLSLNSGNLIRTGMPNATFTERYGFQTAGSTSVTGQAAVNALTAAVGGTAVTAAVASAAAAVVSADPMFTYADLPTASANAGAVSITLTATDTTLNAGVAVGQIARVGNFFGVILRIDTTTAIAPVITLIPYDKQGRQQPVAAITAGLLFSVPSIPSINVANHREALLIANRAIREPSGGSGAIATTLRDPQTNQLIQVFFGQYDLTTVSEGRAYYQLTGALLSDTRKACLMLSL
jgi:hypothetical protein